MLASNSGNLAKGGIEKAKHQKNCYVAIFLWCACIFSACLLSLKIGLGLPEKITTFWEIAWFKADCHQLCLKFFLHRDLILEPDSLRCRFCGPKKWTTIWHINDFMTILLSWAPCVVALGTRFYTSWRAGNAEWGFVHIRWLYRCDLSHFISGAKR